MIKTFSLLKNWMEENESLTIESQAKFSQIRDVQDGIGKNS